MASKKNILIVDSGHYFYDCVLPTIKTLFKRFDIHLVIFDYHTDLYTKKIISHFKRKKIIKSFFIIEHSESGSFINLIMQIKSLKKIKEFYKNTKIDYSFFANYSMNVTKYFIYNILDPKCKKVFLQYRELLFLTGERRAIIKQDYHKFFFIKYIYFKLKKFKSFVPSFFKNIIFSIFLKTSLKNDKVEKRTKVLSEKLDLLFMNDQTEFLKLKTIHKNQTYLINSPSKRCKCKKTSKKFPEALLLGENSYILKDVVPQKFLHNYSEDIDFICKQFNLKSIHHKLHPRATGNWYLKLKTILEKKGYNYIVLKKENYISKVICNYKVYSSGHSGSLRIARNTCNDVNIVAIKSASYPAHGVVDFENLADYNGVEWLGNKKDFNKKNSFLNKKKIFKRLEDYIN